MPDRDIPFALPFIGDEEKAAVLRALDSLWLTTGKEAAAFENEFAAFLENPPAAPQTAAVREAAWEAAPLRAFAVNSATSGLHLALEACGAGPGDTVLLPSYTFASDAEVVRYLNAEPIFVDTKPGCFHLDPAALEAALDRLSRGLPAWPGGPAGRPAAVIPVHYAGLPCDMEAITEIARHYGARIIEDAAHSFPSLLPDGRFAGTLGDVGVFSFYATKTITTGEGGMVVTRDPEIAVRVKVMRLHGIDRDVWNRYTDRKSSWYYEVVEPGYKYNLPDILAAIGRVQLKRAWELFAMRKKIAAKYDGAFRDNPHVIIPPTGPGDARHLYPVRINLTINRDAFIDKLKEKGIGVSVHFIPLHIMPYYKKRYKLEAEQFPESLKIFRQVISLPIWPGMTDNQIDRVIDAVGSIAREAARGE
ncbi:MAG: DegT/DnrJ/EryC1/StrS aminotransferase family protein [Spirochaetaceae bacterium]|jgi:dTDP-4-amino-4,6-dideoxygalactose transaminase|nr:DegT/DnrJ/EryC1/StrS aminotransferase family protein [Spirochaetaceae bacterium]